MDAREFVHNLKSYTVHPEQFGIDRSINIQKN